MDPLRCAFLLITPARGWAVSNAVHGGLTLRSPRGDGSIHFSTVEMPAELGSYDVRKLWDRACGNAWPPSIVKRFDRLEWTDEEAHIEGIAFSSMLSLAQLAEMGIAPPPHHPEFQTRLIRRDWCIAQGPLVVDVAYTSADEPRILLDSDGDEIEGGNANVAADLVECAEMVRDVRFARTTDQ